MTPTFGSLAIVLTLLTGDGLTGDVKAIAAGIPVAGSVGNVALPAVSQPLASGRPLLAGSEAESPRN